MKNIDRAYIGIELGTHTWNVDLEENAMNDILDEGIEGSTEDIYKIIYEGYNCSENHLRMMLDEQGNEDNMLYPLDCYEDLSYNDWLQYKKEMDEDKKRELLRRKQQDPLPIDNTGTGKLGSIRVVTRRSK